MENKISDKHFNNETLFLVSFGDSEREVRIIDFKKDFQKGLKTLINILKEEGESETKENIKDIRNSKNFNDLFGKVLENINFNHFDNSDNCGIEIFNNLNQAINSANDIFSDYANDNVSDYDFVKEDIRAKLKDSFGINKEYTTPEQQLKGEKQLRDIKDLEIDNVFVKLIDNKYITFFELTNNEIMRAERIYDIHIYTV